MTFSPTDEQLACVDMARSQQSFKVVAYAGAGKTTTLKLISDDILAHYPHARGLYLAFNKTIASEAAQKFDNRVRAMTFHSLAYRHVPRSITQKVNAPKATLLQIAHELQLKPLHATRTDKLGNAKKVVFSNTRLAQIVQDGLSVFCKTHAPIPAMRHLPLPDWLSDDDDINMRNALYPALLGAWERAIDPRHHGNIGHDIYLKYWTLSNPIVPADFVLFDEAQDADPLMMGVLLHQRAQIIYVGDAHQQIYEWRGATNAMKRLPLPQSLLTQSFRFGTPIANIANLLLKALGETTPLIGNAHTHSSVGTHFGVDAVLCRTNAGAMARLLLGLKRGERVGLAADTQRIVRFCQNALKLQTGKACDSGELAGFSSWREVQSSNHFELKTWVRLIDEHGAKVVGDALDTVNRTSQPDYIICTAHKAKGLEWNSVALHDDFVYELSAKTLKIAPEELRLLYVAVTRAKHRLDIGAHTPLFDALARGIKVVYSQT